MKKYNCLLILLVSVFLLLCACTKEQATPASSDPDTLSSVPSSFASIPSSVPATSVPAQLFTDWLIEDREIVPFEDRFKEDVQFGSSTSWLIQDADTYICYSINRTYFTETVEYGIFLDDKMVYPITDAPELAKCGLLAGDGQSAYLYGEAGILKMDLLTGEYTVFLQFGSDIIFWRVGSCDKDTICVFTVDTQRNLRIYYRDLRSNAEKTLYEGILPESSPHDFVSFEKYSQVGNQGISFTPPQSTNGTFSWRMMNPAFYTVLQKELANPDSQFKHVYKENYYAACWEDPENHPIHLSTYTMLCDAIENAYDIPYRVEYTYNPITGTLTEDYGIVDTCLYGSGYAHDHYDYENTREEPLLIVDAKPIPIPNITKLTEAQLEESQEDESNRKKLSVFLYSDYGFGVPYLKQGDRAVKLADIPCQGIIATQHYIYCITAEQTIVQISPDGSICNTIYTANGVLDDWFYQLGSIYVQDGNQVIRIDTINGTSQVLLESKGNIYIDSNGFLDEQISVDITQGLYYQQHFYNTVTGELEEVSYL